jgi:transcriptional regulator with XRE-family HTH domain
LQERINSLLFERTAISKKPEETIRQDLTQLRTQGQQSADLTFRDPYVLDFLGLSDSYSEKDLESAILSELQRFIIELGSDFAFMARQKRITIDQAAASLGVSVSRWSHIERTWGRQPLLRRLEALQDIGRTSLTGDALKAHRKRLSLSLSRLAATAEMTRAQALQVEEGIENDLISQLRLSSSLHRLSLIRAREATGHAATP